MSLSSLSSFNPLSNLFSSGAPGVPTRREVKNYFVENEETIPFDREVPEQFRAENGGFDAKGNPFVTLFEHHGSALEPVYALMAKDSVCYLYGYSDERFAVVPNSEIARH